MELWNIVPRILGDYQREIAMDIKKDRRDAAVTGRVWDKTLPDMEGMYPGTGGNPNRKGQGSAASDNNIGWDVRAQSWQRGADTDYASIQAEKDENDTKWGVPCKDTFPAPSDPKGPSMCGARYQTGSYDADKPLGNPNNFSSNPGYMSVGTGDIATSGNPGNGMTANIATSGSRGSLPGASSLGGRRQTSGGIGPSASRIGGSSTIGRSASLGSGNTTLPAPGDTDPGAEGSPLVVSSGYSG